MHQSDLHLYECRLSDLILQDRIIATESLTNSVLDQIKTVGTGLIRKMTDMFVQPFLHTELKDFLAKYHTQYTAYIAQPLQAIPSVPITIPAGMIHSYGITSSRLHDHLYMGDVNITQVIEATRSALTNAQILNRQDDAHARERLQKLYVTAHGQLTQTSKILTVLTTDLFDPTSPLNTALAPSQFQTKRALKQTTDSVLSMGDIYRSAEVSRKRIDELFTQSQTLIDSIHPNTSKMHREDLLMFAFILNKSAQIFRLYGVTLTLVQQVEHAYTQALRTLLPITR